MIRISHFFKRYHNQVIFEDLSLAIDTGEVVVIIGPSGAGKSTLLRCINGLECLNGGHLELHDFQLDLAKANAHQLQYLRSKMGFVFQHYALFANKTALENITEGLIYAHGMSKAAAKDEGLFWLNQVGLRQYAHRYPKALSGGQQQRVGIARALAQRPDLLLFDEPTSALDPETVHEVLELMRHLAEEHRTMLIVTHEIRFAKEVATRIVFLDHGTIVEQGPPEEILNNPTDPKVQAYLSKIL